MNEEIDEIIQRDQLGHCCVVLTSRTSDQLRNVRKYMDLEVDILGFDEKTAEIYAGKYLGDHKKAETLMKKVNDIDNKNLMYSLENNLSTLQTLVQLPILLQMLCVLNEGPQSLPETKGEIIEAMVQRTIQRSAIRVSGKRMKLDTEAILQRLGKAAWDSLKQKSQQLLITKVCIIACSGPNGSETMGAAVEGHSGLPILQVSPQTSSSCFLTLHVLSAG